MSDGLGHLKQAIRDDRLVLFVGSGVSMTAGLPSWPAVGRALMEELRSRNIVPESYVEQVDTVSPLTIGTLGRQKLSPTDYGTFLARHFHSTRQSEVHLALRALSCRRVVTTNWDVMLEEMNYDLIAAHDPGRPCQNAYAASFTQDDAFQLDLVGRNELTAWIFHLHGVYYRPRTVVWSQETYDEVVARPEVKHLVNRLLHDYTVLYVGFSLRDPHFEIIQRRLLEMFGKPSTHYALLPAAEANELQRAELFDRYGVVVLPYAVDATLPREDQHTPGLVSVLRELAPAEVTQPGPNVRKGRSGEATRTAFEAILRDAALPDERVVDIYASAGHDFLLDHREHVTSLLARGGQVRMLLLDKRVKVSVASRAPVDLLTWRGGLEKTNPTTRSNHVVREQAEVLRLAEEIEADARAIASGAATIDMRSCSAFPINTICRIGDRLFDCPRPVGKKSVQSPMFEYRRGSFEFAFFCSQFNRLWQSFSEELRRNRRPRPVQGSRR